MRLNGLSPGVRRLIVGVVGSLMIAAGVAMIFLPGPAFIVIPLGLAILAREFNWARRWMRKARDIFKRIRRKRTEATKRNV
jgi:tellurite resistance protein TerC